MDGQWSRRTLLRLAGAATIPLAGCSTLASVPSTEYKPLTEHYGDKDVTDTDDRLRLEGPEEPVERGTTISFTVTNTGSEDVSLGCHNPWTIQQQADGQWRDVIWTNADGFPTCLTKLAPGGTRSEQVTLDRSALTSETETVQFDLTPGLYRFVLLATDPFFAADFRIRES